MAYRLANQSSLDHKFIMSAKGDFIYIVLKADEEDLSRVADHN